ncbi:hypothetical protein Patl1_29341 [Pistacia atlantica]|uniref:Uncharacterized protein n=1 Tax=Pistacia atlantica TaxID=434234 RepID=A0ACC1BC57_9ROSI|nr:hypothetical protein Patl1_29341 [Pistacia atlantica]
MIPAPATKLATLILLVVGIWISDSEAKTQKLTVSEYEFGPFNSSYYNIFSVISPATISNEALQVTPDSAGNFTLVNRSGRYDGANKFLEVYMAEQKQGPQGPIISRPSTPVLTADLDLSTLVNQNSYFGFAASTGSVTQLNCVLRWNLTVELLPGLGYYVHKKRAADDPNILGTLKSLPGTPREFSFRDLKKATNNFDDKHKLGQGGFGVVFKGVLPKENLEIAVKKFCRDNLKGKDDFLAELTIINRLRHKHLVRLQGWCHKNGMLLLVYDYMPNGSLDNHLFYESEEKKTLVWELRYKIISGVTSALHYLHNEYDQKVVHRDLKASNIMLDSNFNARLGDFGLARALDNEKTSYAELEGVPGTMGYIAPECFHTGKATRESDVYGFGAVVLEVVCGQRPWTQIAGFQLLVDWVWLLHRDGRILEAVDQRLANEFVCEEAERLLLLGLACSHPIASERPNTQTILQIISGSVPVPHVPPFKPAFVWPSTPGPSSFSITSSTANRISGSGSGSGWTPHYNQGGGDYSDSSSLV